MHWYLRNQLCSQFIEKSRKSIKNLLKNFCVKIIRFQSLVSQYSSGDDKPVQPM